MPAVSKRQRRAMAIAEHHPEELYARNASLKKMGKEKLREFTSTSEKGLPDRAQQYHIMKRRRARRSGK